MSSYRIKLDPGENTRVLKIYKEKSGNEDFIPVGKLGKIRLWKKAKYMHCHRKILLDKDMIEYLHKVLSGLEEDASHDFLDFSSWKFLAVSFRDLAEKVKSFSSEKGYFPFIDAQKGIIFLDGPLQNFELAYQIPIDILSNFDEGWETPIMFKWWSGISEWR